MNRATLRRLLERVRSGEQDIDEALLDLAELPFEDVTDMKLDHHRSIRTGIPEAIFGQGKTPEQVKRAVERLSARGSDVLATRLDAEVGLELQQLYPHGEWSPEARVFHLRAGEQTELVGDVGVVSAGTSDGCVAAEAAITARALGANVTVIQDVGVAGLHRLLAHRRALSASNVVVVVAGMEGALASVVAGLVDSIVIAVPTSVGYGASFGGLAALLAMLNSCGAGVLVTNIDNGFGAGVAAARINRLAESK